MTDDKTSILADFEEFLKARDEANAQASAEEDFEVEIWDEKGRGVRTRRSHAKKFLNTLGIDLDPEPSGDNSGQSSDGNTGDKSKSGRPPAGKQSNATGSQSVARKYFARKAATT